MTSAVILVLAVFGASCVEAVEALTLVVASGTTRGWRSAFEGAIAALVLLVVLVVAIGVPLVHYVPIDVLRVVIGGLLLVLGLGWLRKSILRASGHKALHDEDLIFANTVAQLGTETSSSTKGRDAIGFTIAFKGVLLEGTEVLLIVLSLGASSHRLGLAAAAAGAAALLVTAVGVVVARQLREVPENTMKLAVGVMLTSFGVFWVGEGSGFHWPGSDLAILVLIALFVAVTFGAIRYLRSLLSEPARNGTLGSSSREPLMPSPKQLAVSFGRFWWEFLIGENPDAFVSAVVIIGAALLLRHDRVAAIIVVPLLAVVGLAGSAYRGRKRL